MKYSPVLQHLMLAGKISDPPTASVKVVMTAKRH